jgi:RHS repeat-associated protein
LVIAYDDLGNITSKSDACTAGACTYSYGSGAGPHALTSISGTVNGVVNPTYSYDANGNMTSGAGRTVSYTSFNMAESIVEGTTADCFTYDTEHQRVKMEGRESSCTGTLNNTTYYLNDPASGAMSEKFVAGSTTTWRDYIMADGHMVAERFKVVGGSTSLRYFVLDHLGSVAAITDEAGTVTERLSYDAWGKRRNADGSDAACGSISSATTRGFTGHEELDDICLINMNARIYDPVVGRFMAADEIVQAPFNLQSWNAYTYVFNNPLSFTDPSGNVVETVLVTDTPLFSNPGTAIVAVVIDIATAILGADLFGAAAAPPVAVTVSPPNLAQSPTGGGNPSGNPQPANTAADSAQKAADLQDAEGGQNFNNEYVDVTAKKIAATSIPQQATNGSLMKLGTRSA